jgi:hypothetical protein
MIDLLYKEEIDRGLLDHLDEYQEMYKEEIDRGLLDHLDEYHEVVS